LRLTQLSNGGSIEMKSRIPKLMQVSLILAGITAMSLSTVALTKAPSGWLRTSFKGLDRISAQENVPPTATLLSVAPSDLGKVRVKSGCVECGVVGSVRRIVLSGDAPATYEMTVRMRDGSARVVGIASDRDWRARQHVILIGGGNPLDR
jgi:hypothetical protein